MTPGISQSPIRQFWTHCLIRCVIRPSSPNVLGGTWKRTSLPDIRDISASEVSTFNVIALYKSTFTYLLTYLQTMVCGTHARAARRCSVTAQARVGLATFPVTRRITKNWNKSWRVYTARRPPFCSRRVTSLMTPRYSLSPKCCQVKNASLSTTLFFLFRN